MPDKFSLWQESPETLKAFIRNNVSGLEKYEKSAVFAKTIAADDNLFILSPNSRLRYIQGKIKHDGLKDFSDVDSHTIAEMLQFVYGVDMNARPDAVFDHMIMPFVTEENRRKGYIECSDDGMIRSAITEEQAKAFKKELGLTSEEEEKMNSFLSSLFEGDVDINEIYERNFFGHEGSYNVTDERLTKGLEILADAYKERFGNPGKRGEYKCVVRAEILDNCKKLMKRETGRDAPGAKILFDTKSDTYYVDNGCIILPYAFLQDPVAGLQGILFGMSHLILGNSERGYENFLKDRKREFKRVSWEEGVAGRMIEAGLKDAQKKGDLKGCRIKEEIAKGFAQQLSVGYSLHPVSIKKHGLGHMVTYDVYVDMSYPYGWHFVRKPDRGTFIKMLDGGTPWNNPDIGWNRPLNMQSRKYFELVTAAKRILAGRYSDNPDVMEAVLNSLDEWKREFLYD